MKSEEQNKTRRNEIKSEEQNKNKIKFSVAMRI
jgi:hypothetical protein